MKRSKTRKLHKTWKTPTKWALFGLLMGLVLATVGSVAALNGWFGGGGSIPEDTMTRGLLGYWGFEEGSGSMAYDSSDNSNNGTLKYMTTSTNAWTKGKVGSALSFDGTDDYVDVGDQTSLEAGSGSLTVEAWIKYSSIITTEGHVVSKRTGGAAPFAGYQLYVRKLDNTVHFTFDDNVNTYRDIASASAYNDNQFHHVVGIIDRTDSKIKLYVDGVDVGTGANSIAGYGSDNNTDNFSIGRWYPSATSFFNGTIDEVRIYNRALSAEEIRYHYNRGGPVVQWKFDEGEGQTVYDSTDNNNDGTLATSTDTSSADPTWSAGKYGSALSFDGTDDYVDGPNVSANARTVSFWLKRGDTSNKDVIDLGTPEIKITSNAITSTGLTSPTHYVDAISNTTAVSANQWHYITITDTADINANNIDIGKASTNFFNGLIDDVRIYNYARTPEEIRLDYNAGYAAHFGPKTDCKRDPGACMTQGLVGYWGLEEGSGGQAYDQSDYANHGTTSGGPQWTKGKVGGALSFDGTNDYVVTANSNIDISAANTFEAWVQVHVDPGVAPLRRHILMKSASNLRGLAWEVSGYGVTGFGFEPDAAINGARFNYTPSTNWVHIVGTWDGSLARIYMNGVLKHTGSDGGTWTNANDPFTMFGSNYLDGVIDEARVYNRALSAEEIRYHYNRGGPVAQWKLDEGEGRTAYDSTDNNNDGTLILVGSATSSAWVSGKYGGALSFDGTDDYVDIGNTSQTSVKTVSFWIKANDITSRKVIDIDGTDQVEIDASSQITATSFPGTITYYLNGIAGSRTLIADTWYHVVITDTSGVNASNMDIGRVSTGYFDGLIDDVRIYDYARTPEQIRQDYNQGLSAHFK